VCKILALASFSSSALWGQIDPMLMQKLDIKELSSVYVKAPGVNPTVELTLGFKNENDFTVGIRDETFDVTLDGMTLGEGEFLGKVDGVRHFQSTSSLSPVKVVVSLDNEDLVAKLAHIINATGPNRNPSVTLSGEGVLGMELKKAGSGESRGWVYTDMIQVEFQFQPQVQGTIEIE
jgi:LEA14-like dessication related protein